MVDDVVSLLSDLVKIPSVCGDESRIASFIADWLRKNGVSAELMDVEPGRPNVVAILKGEKPGPRIMLNGHMDTVEPGRGWTHDPYGAEIRDGRMYGRGTIDMKSGLACILWATATARQENLVKRGELIVAAVVDEEAIDRGTYALVRKGLSNGLDFALISEATDLKVVTAHRGRAVFDVEVHGRAAHSHWPDHGINAIENAAILLNALPKLKNPIHPRLGNCTVNTLKIEGGQDQVMLVPDRCRLLVDRCLVPGYVSKQALADLLDLINDLGIEATAKLVDRETPFCEPFEIPDNNPHVQSIVNAADHVLGKKPELSFHEGPCDSCIMVSEGKVPTIEYGPTGGRLHESDEYVVIESVTQAAEVYLEIIKRAFESR